METQAVRPIIFRRSAAIMIAAVGAIHLALAGEYLGEQAYIGALFFAGAAGSFLVAVSLWMARSIAVWTLGAIIAAGMFIGFVLSRTVGLPGFKEADWELSGIVSLLLEAAYLGSMVAWFATRRRRLAWQARRRQARALRLGASRGSA